MRIHLRMTRNSMLIERVALPENTLPSDTEAFVLVQTWWKALAVLKDLATIPMMEVA